MKKLFLFAFISVSFLQTACGVAAEDSLQAILAAKQPPAGVVFELATVDDDGMDWAIPLVRNHATQLRAKFPGIKLAVVSHGLEQFQLVQNEKKQSTDAHRKVASLIKDKDIEVHVCGNFASMMDVGRDEFIDVVKVAHRAPAQVKEFMNAGYALILISEPE